MDHLRTMWREALLTKSDPDWLIFRQVSDRQGGMIEYDYPELMAAVTSSPYNERTLYKGTVDDPSWGDSQAITEHSVRFKGMVSSSTNRTLAEGFTGTGFSPGFLLIFPPGTVRAWDIEGAFIRWGEKSHMRQAEWLLAPGTYPIVKRDEWQQRNSSSFEICTMGRG
jgi:hypothetical protein